MGKPGPPGTQKRRADGEEEENRVLKANRFAALASDNVEKKERLPPFYTKGFPEHLYKDIDYYVKRGLQATLRRCTGGYKITVPSANHYKAVEELLKRESVEYFTHDKEAEKPLKVILRGLDDMDVKLLEEELKEAGLKPQNIHKIKRHNVNRRYRDQLYLIHLPKGSTTIKELQSIHALFLHSVEWERYKPVHREVTQCANCLGFGHGGKNCHLKSRCSGCGGNHATSDCAVEDAPAKCVNCDQDHSSKSRACPKRAEYIQFRKQANQRNRRPKKQQGNIDLGLDSFPELPPSKGARPAQSQNNSTPPPGFWGNVPSSGTSFQQGPQPTAPPPPDGLTQAISQLTSLVTEMQKMLMTMMQFFMRCQIRPQTP